MRAPRFQFSILLASFLLFACGGGGSGGGGGGEGGALPGCQKDADCDDSFYCNGVEVCDQGLCRQGTKVACDDGIECTVDRCDESTKACASSAKDADGDGHGVAGCVDAENKPLGDDCNDEDALVFPGNDEVCDPDNRDEDCNPKTIGERDTDGDGYLDAVCCNEQKNGKLECGDDCDDHRTNVSPAAVEACDGYDNDCDGKVDDGVSIDMYPDLDHDGHGDSAADAVKSCPGAVGLALVANDCDDDDPEVFEGQFEICDEKDNNCDEARLVDEVQEQAPWYLDTDKDGYGDPLTSPVFSCSRPAGRVLSHNDCDDGNKKVNPNATEICDALDNDCNGQADFRVGAVANNFEDNDGDGFADADCGGGDCDDTNPYTATGAPEFCDFIDNDCDDAIDEDVVTNIWYVDSDGDGWGVGFGTAIASCVPISGLANKYGDCNDGNANALPGGVEFCDGVDQDCDGVVDDGATAYCQLENAISRCYQGACRIYTCTAGFKDADGDPENGCEAPQAPNERTYLGFGCSTSGACNDSNYCNGQEICFEGDCYAGNPIHCEVGENVVQGNVTIANGLDLKFLSGVTTITGNLIIENTSLTTLVGLESLRVIGGNLRILGNDYLVKLSGSALSGLEVIGGQLYLSGNGSLESVYLPSLVSLGSFYLYDEYYEGPAAPISKVDLPSLVQIEQGFSLTPSSETLAEISLPKLASAGYIDIFYDPYDSPLTKIDFSSLVTVGTYFQVNAPIKLAGAGLSIGKLRKVGLPSNNGSVQACVGTLNPPCEALDALVSEGGHSGSIDTCGTCQAKALKATIAAGNHHACAIVSGDVKCWGHNEYGEVGATTLGNNASPTSVGLTDTIEVAVGSSHSCALSSAGTVKCWGHNGAQQLGVDAEMLSSSSSPVAIPGVTTAKRISAGGYGTCVILADGTLTCWGGIYNAPASFGGLENVESVDVGTGNACAVETGGVIRCWGVDTYGQLGWMTPSGETDPVQILTNYEPETFMTDAAFATVGAEHTCIRRSSGNVDCIGVTASNRAGTTYSDATCNSGTTPCAKFPSSSGHLWEPTSISAGTLHTCGIMGSGGAVRCFGDNSAGQLSNGYDYGDGEGGGYMLVPLEQGNAREVVAGDYFTCMRLTSGEAYCFGANDSNQLGFDLAVVPDPPSYTGSLNPVAL